MQATSKSDTLPPHALGPPEKSFFILPSQKNAWKWPLAGMLTLGVAFTVTFSVLAHGGEAAGDGALPSQDSGGALGSIDTNRFERGMGYMARMRNLSVDVLTMNGLALTWYHLDDVVMGGSSASSVSTTASGALRFAGNISTHGGGFASCSTMEQSLGLPASTTDFNLTMSGNGELFQFSLKTSTNPWAPSWHADLPAMSLEPGVMHSFALPLRAFRATRMGQSVAGASLDITKVQAVGLSLALLDSSGAPNPHFRDGPFEVTLQSVTLVSGPPAPPAPAAPPPVPHSINITTNASQAVLLASFDGQSRDWRVMNDQVMGGGSTSSFLVAGGAGLFQGACAIVSFLNAPGFCKISTRGTFPDASAWIDGGLHLTVRSTTTGYKGFKVDFSSDGMPVPQGFRHGYPAFKAAFQLPALASSDFVTVRVPFSAFSVDTSEFTGRCDTTDPTGLHHHCCSTDHPEVCPQSEHLKALTGLQVWAEGIEGDFELEIREIKAGP